MSVKTADAVLQVRQRRPKLPQFRFLAVDSLPPLIGKQFRCAETCEGQSHFSFKMASMVLMSRQRRPKLPDFCCLAFNHPLPLSCGLRNLLWAQLRPSERRNPKPMTIKSRPTSTDEKHSRFILHRCTDALPAVRFRIP
jgi:hypothetical protein